MALRPPRPLVALASLALALATSCSGSDAPLPHATTWPEADALFRSDPRWLGADGAYSIPLGGERTLWLFGDTFVAREPRDPWKNPAFLRNTIGIQHGLDPSRAFMRFYWQTNEDGQPRSWLPEDGKVWHWPGHGIVIDGVLVMLWGRVGTPADDPDGYEGAGPSRVLVVDNPDDEPVAWRPREGKVPADAHDVDLGGAVLREGDKVYVYGSRGALHEVFVARYDVSRVREGDLSTPAWYADGAWSTAEAPTAITGLNAPEYSVHHDAKLGKYVMAITEGYGAATLAIRVADAPEGPWSQPRSFLRPPESFDDDAFVYAGKGHPELLGADLVMTYVPASFAERDDEASRATLYHPHFARLTWP